MYTHPFPYHTQTYGFTHTHIFSTPHDVEKLSKSRRSHEKQGRVLRNTADELALAEIAHARSPVHVYSWRGLPAV